MKPRLELALSLALLLGTLFVITPRTLFDSDELLRIGAGRAIARHGGPPEHDPLTFSQPRARWNNPEWLGDALIHALDSALGRHALIVYKLCLLGVALAVALLLAVRRGAPPLVAAAVLALALAAAFPRFSVRNHLHAYWLLPLFGLLLDRLRQRARKRALVVGALLVLGALWSTLHGSFVLSWVCLLAAGAAIWLRDDVDGNAASRRRLLGVLALLLAVFAALPLLGPSGLAGYDQLLDHVRNGALYRALISEWQPTLSAPLFVRLPVHALALACLLSALHEANRRRAGGALEMLAAVALAHASLRFVPLMLFLAGPALAANLARVWKAPRDDATAQRRQLLLRAAAALVLCATALSIGLQHAPRPLLQTGRTHFRAAGWLGAHARGGLRLFAPFNAGAYLLGIATPAVRLYIDPRNNLGGDALRTYLATRRDIKRFDSELVRTGAEAVMVDIADGADDKIAAHLAAQPRRFELCYFDGFYAVYAISAAKGAALLPRYRALRATNNPSYTLTADAAALRADLQRLRGEAPPVAAAIAGYRSWHHARTLAATTNRREQLLRAAGTLASALPRLPPSEALMVALADSYLLCGKRAAARDVLRAGLTVYPRSAPLRALAARAR